LSTNGFCTLCGAPRTAGANFCTACGGVQSGGTAPRPAIAPASRQVNAIAAGALLLAIGGAAAWFAMQTPTDVPRAVAGSPSGGAPQGQGQAQGEGLPQGHPSIDLPKEVVDFLDGLTAEAEKNPQSVEAAQKLARARYRATVINESYRAPAEQALAKLFALDPGNLEGLRIAANLSYDAGDFPEAEKRFRTFLDKAPGDPSAMTDLGSTLLFQDRPDEAIASYKAAIEKDPKFMQAWFNLGIAHEKKGQKDEAIVALRRAAELAEAPDQKQHVENALAELEGRTPQQIAGAGAPAAPDSSAPTAQGGAPAGSAPAAQGSAMPGGAPSAGAPGGMGGMGGAPGGGMPMPPPAPDRAVPTNASSDFQRQAEKPIITHPIVGPRIVGFEWTGPASGRAKLADFPMDRMPPFARVKFKSVMAEKIAAVAKTNGVAGPVKMELVDDASGNVMDTLDTATDAPGGMPPGGAAPGGMPK
jgi:Tfp pilus assembly protein PilF